MILSHEQENVHLGLLLSIVVTARLLITCSQRLCLDKCRGSLAK